ncbi:MAG: contractile injection system tape measure protein [Methylococcaceae bacterium]|nr:contractile injection system tape measure protein [Methylococcaceae bacterium]
MGDDIRTLVFDLETASEDAARRIQNRVGDFSSRDLNRVLEDCLAEFADADTVYGFERIELELGILSEQNLEQELAERIGNRLREYLAARIPVALLRQSGETPPWPDEPLPAPLAELSAFLLRGIPANGNPDRLLSAVLDRFPLPLKRLLRTWGQRSIVRKRMAYQLSTALLCKLVRLLEPDDLGFIIETVRNLGRVLGAREGIQSERAGWEFMLAYLLAERGAYFDPAASIASVLRQMAGRYSLADDELMERFAAISSDSSLALRDASLRLRARSLAGGRASRFAAYPELAMDPSIAAEAGELSLNRRRLQILAVFLEWGVSPSAVTPQLGLDELLLELIRQSPDELLYLVRRIGLKEPVRKRLAGEFPEPSIQRLVGLLEPAGANLVCAYVGEVLRVQARRTLVQQETRVFGKALWEFVLTFLLVERGSRFNARSFVKSTLTRMAARYRIAYHELLQSLIACAQSFHLPVSQKYTLPAVLLSLQEEANLGWIAEDAESSASPSEEDRPGAYSERDVLVYWLGHGSLPVWNPLPRSADLRSLFSRLSAQNPQGLAAALCGFEGAPSVLERLTGILGDSTARRLLKQLAPADGEIIQEFLDILQEGGRIHALPGLDDAASSMLLRELVFGFLLAAPRDFRLEALVWHVRTELDRRFRSAEQALADFWSGTLEAIRRRSPPAPRLEAAMSGVRASLSASAEAAPSVTVELERLLMYGVSPVVLRGGSKPALAAWLAGIGDAELIAVWHRIGPKEVAIRRMVWHLPEVFYFRVIDLLAGTDSAFVQTLRQALEALAGRGDLQPPAPAMFRRRAREYLLAILLNPADRPTLQLEWVRRMAWALASRYGTGFQRLLQALAQADPALERICLDLAGAGRRLEEGQTGIAEVRLPNAADPLASLMIFLETGHIGVDCSDAPQRWLAEALAAQEGRLLAALKNIGGKPAVLLRLLHYLPEPELARLVRALSTAHAGFILGFLSLGAGLETADDFPPGPRRRARQIHWQVVLSFLLDPHAPGFTERGFIAEVSGLIAQRLSISVALYVDVLLRIARDRAQTRARLRSVVEALSQIQGPGDGAASGVKRPPVPETGATLPFEGLPVAGEFTEALSVLRHFLQYGCLPQSGPIASWQALAERFEREWPSHSADYRKLLREAVGREPERLRMAKFFPQVLFSSVLALLLPAQNAVAQQALNALTALMPGLASGHRDEIFRDELLLAIHRRGGRRFDWGLYFRDVLRRLAAGEASDSLEWPPSLRQAIARQGGGAREVLLRALDGVEREIVLDCDLGYFAGSMGDRETPAIAEDKTTDQTLPSSADEPLVEEAPKMQEPTAILSAFEYFLKQGYLSPVCEPGNLAALADCVLSEWGKHHGDELRLLQWAAGRSEGRARLLEMFPREAFHSLLRLLQPQEHELVERVFDAVEGASAMTAGSSPRRWRHAAMDEWLLCLHRRGDFAAYLRVLPRRLAAELGVKEAGLRERLRREILLQSSPRRGWLLRALNDCEREESSGKEPTGLEGKRQSLRSGTSAAEELPENEAFYVDNAGMVLLWPFLSRYFQMLDLQERGAFRDVTAQCRAVYLLQYLVSAEEEAPEYRLLLNKILCGLETSLPLEPQARLTDDERRSSEELLYGFTRNWSKLHHTSIAGLREAFLQREGRLVRKEETWTLTVAQKSYDILLDTLPWNLSLIKLGWMQTLLQVKWR